MTWWEKQKLKEHEVYRGFYVDIWYFRYDHGELEWVHHKASGFWTHNFWTLEELGHVTKGT